MTSSGAARVIDLIRPQRRLLMSALAVLAAGCASEPPPPTSAASDGHQLVSEGYSLMYDTVSKLRFGDELLLVKIEADPVDEIISDISTYAAELKGKFEEFAGRDPVVKLELKLLPAMEVMTRDSVAGERVPDLLSRSGKDFERLLLLTQSGTLNQSRHLARVMVDTETNPERKALWLGIQARLDHLYDRTVSLLQQDYFCNDAAQSARQGPETAESGRSDAQSQDGVGQARAVQRHTGPLAGTRMTLDSAARRDQGDGSRG